MKQKTSATFLLICLLLNSCGSDSETDFDNTLAEVSSEISDLRGSLNDNEDIVFSSLGYTGANKLFKPCGDLQASMSSKLVEINRIESKFNSSPDKDWPVEAGTRDLKKEIFELKDFLSELSQNLEQYCSNDSSLINSCSSQDSFVKILINKNTLGLGFVHPCLKYSSSAQFENGKRFSSSSIKEDGYLLFNRVIGDLIYDGKAISSSEVNQNNEIKNTIECLNSLSDRLETSLGKSVINAVNDFAEYYHL